MFWGKNEIITRGKKKSKIFEKNRGGGGEIKF
jgi:hypothetical protein